MTKRKSKGAYMISAVAEMYGIHPQTLRLYEREGLLKPSRTEGNTRLYTDEDLQRLEFILSLARDLGVNISGDRKSTRLNSSHDQISYAVFCLKKKKNTYQLPSLRNYRGCTQRHCPST